MRHGRKNLDDEIKAIFGEEQRDRDTSEEPSITYSEYVNKITHRALAKQAAMIKKRAKWEVGQGDDSELHWPYLDNLALQNFLDFNSYLLN